MKKSEENKNFAGQEVDLIAPKSLDLTTQWETLIPEWASQSGASPKILDYDATESIANSPIPAVSSGGSLLFFPLHQLCEVEATLGALPASEGELDGRDLFKGLRERVLSRGGQLIANPISVPVLVCYFRNDLLRASGRKIPETWDEYHELVETLPEWAPGLIAVEPLSPEFRSTTFFARSLAYCKHPENYSVWFDIDTAKPTVNSAGFIRGLEMAQKTWKKLPPEVMTYSPSDCRRLMLTGKAAMTLSFESQSADLKSHLKSEMSSENPRVDGIELGICRMPGSRTVYNRNSKKWDAIPDKGVHAPALCGFAGLAAGVRFPSKQDNPSAAVNLLVNLSSSALFDQAFASLPKGPCRESQLAQAPTWFGPALSTEEAGRYCDVVAQSLRDTQLVFELPLIGSEEFRRAASVGLEPLLRGEATVEQTLETIQQSFQSIVDGRGWESVRDSYRRGLGMTPVPSRPKK